MQSLAGPSSNASSSVADNSFVRERPVIVPDAHLRPPPDHFDLVEILHPVVLKPFLRLAAYDYASSDVLGVHYATVFTACWALAGNCNGHLTLRNGTTITKEPDDVLPTGEYLYFLDGYSATKNYAICTEFKNWPFPDTVPAAWDTTPTTPRLAGSVTSSGARARDRFCTMSGENWSLTSARVVPFTEIDWLYENRQHLSLGFDFHKDSTNLITLNAGLHVPQFDDGVWVPVPKCGQYLIHFLRPESVLAERYHNAVFDGGSVTSGRLLLARFVWSNCKNLQRIGFHLRFRSFGDGGNDDDDEDDGKGKGKHEDGGGKTKKRPKPDENSYHGGKRGTHDSCEPPTTRRRTQASRGNQDDEVTVSDEELKSLHDLSDLVAFAGHKLPSEEYPGQAEIERRKEEYIKLNPQIFQRSDQVLLSDYFPESMWD